MKKFLRGTTVLKFIATALVTAAVAGCAKAPTATPTPAPTPEPTATATPEPTASPDAKATPDSKETTPTLTTATGGKFIVGLDENFPPMGFKDEKSEIVGFDVDLAKEAAARMNKEVVFQPIDWDSKELELKTKKIDVIWNGLTITDERKQNMLFSKPYMENNQIIMVQGTSSIKAKADLAGKKVGLQKGSSALDAVNKDAATAASIKEIVEYPDNVSAFMDLDIGRIEAVVVDEIVARYYLSQTGKNYVVLKENFGGEEYGVGMRIDDNELGAELQKAIDAMIADGTAAKISQKWFSEDLMKK